MCQRLYIATRVKLTTTKRSSSSPFLSVAEVSDDPRVRSHFSPGRDFFYVAGAHEPCGCGFPSVLADGEAHEGGKDPKDFQTMGALATHLREACRRHSTVELYLCWAHEETEPPLGRRSASLTDLRDPQFRLRHRELLTVGRAP